jgi:hypothetical protein
MIGGKRCFDLFFSKICKLTAKTNEATLLIVKSQMLLRSHQLYMIKKKKVN